jgi:hypothetical protein
MQSPTARRALGVMVGMVLLAAPSLVMTAPAAEASVKSRCKGQDKVMIKRVEHIKQKFVATHVEAITLAAGSAYSQSTTLEHSKTLKASTDITSEVGGSAGWGFASISAKVSVSVAKEGQSTSSSSVTKTFSISEKPRDRRFALFTGKYQIKGQWHYLSCSRAPGKGTEKFGPIQTFGGTDTGTVLCPRSRYQTSDYRYQVALQAGC